MRSWLKFLRAFSLRLSADITFFFQLFEVRSILAETEELNRTKNRRDNFMKNLDFERACQKRYARPPLKVCLIPGHK